MPAKGHVDGGGDRRVLALVFGLGIAATAAGLDGAARRDRFQQRCLGGAVLPNQQRQRAAQLDIDRATRQERQSLNPLAAACRIDADTMQQQAIFHGIHPEEHHPAALNWPLAIQPTITALA
jgi:hypothetical protein